MANELNIALDPATQTGLSVVARLYAAGAQVGADIALAEIGTSAVYSGDVPGATAAGDYGVYFYDDDTDALLGTGSLGWDGSTEATTRTVQLADDAILSRLGAWTGSARNTILGAMQSLLRKDADATVPSDINADLGAGAGAADNTTDSAQALADKLAAGVPFLQSGSVAVASVSAEGDVTVYQGEGEAITIPHSGTDLTGETLRFTVFKIESDGSVTGIFELEGEAVAGGDGSTQVNLSSAETASALGRNHEWNLWRDPDDADAADLIARGRFRIEPALSAVD